jgi:hypothetical protein
MHVPPSSAARNQKISISRPLSFNDVARWAS